MSEFLQEYHIHKVVYRSNNWGLCQIYITPDKRSMKLIYFVGRGWWSEEILGRVLNGMIYDPRHKSGVYVMCGTSKDPRKKRLTPGSRTSQLLWMRNQVMKHSYRVAFACVSAETYVVFFTNTLLCEDVCIVCILSCMYIHMYVYVWKHLSISVFPIYKYPGALNHQQTQWWLHCIFSR